MADNGGNNVGAAANVQQPANMKQPQLCGSSKPPLFEATLELYRAELELYLDDREAWGVVSGDVTRHDSDQAEQTVFDKRDRLARATILRGLRGCKNDDASKVCGMNSAKEMWDSLVSDHTQRDFSYVMLLKRQLYQCTLEPGQTMADYIRTVTKLRQRMRSMGVEHSISDHEMACVLLMGVAVTHKELIEQFDLPTRQVNPPTLQQVTNALHSRDERDRMMELAGAHSGMVMNVVSGGNWQNGGANNALMAGGNWQTRGVNDAPMAGSNWRNRGVNDAPMTGRSFVKKCYHCKKSGHLRRDCRSYKNKPKKVQGNGSDSVRKANVQTVMQVSGDQKAAGVIDHMQCLNNSKEDSSSDEGGNFVGMVNRSVQIGTPSEWMLDYGSTTHVCIDRTLFTSDKKSRASFKVWTGGVTRGVMSGNVLLHAQNMKGDGVVALELENVEYAPHGTTNLLSLGVMEKTGWIMTTNSPRKEVAEDFLSEW